MNYLAADINHHIINHLRGGLWRPNETFNRWMEREIRDVLWARGGNLISWQVQRELGTRNDWLWRT